MKKFLMGLMSACILVGVLTGCGEIDVGKHLMLVEEAFPEAQQIEQSPYGAYDFLVLDSDGSVWFVSCRAMHAPGISSKNKIFDVPKKVK